MMVSFYRKRNFDLEAKQLDEKQFEIEKEMREMSIDG